MGNTHNFVPSFIDGSPFIVCLPTGRTGYEYASHWDIVCACSVDNMLLHWLGTYCWCQERSDTGERIAYLRGGISPFTVSPAASCRFDDDLGYRPILIPCNPETLNPDPTLLSHLPNGTSLTFGSLYIDGQPLRNPETPTQIGDIPLLDGPVLKSLYVGDTSPDEKQQIHWLKYDGFYFADRPLLRGISWDILDRFGLVFGDGCKGKGPNV